MIPRFEGAVEVKLIDEERNLWQLLADLVFWSAIFGAAILVPKGFITDFASVPRMPILFWLAGDKARAAAIIHDYLYWSGLVDRATADRIFREAMQVSGVPAWRRWGMWAGVRSGGWVAWNRYRGAE